MVSCGYEPTAVQHGFTTLNGFIGMVRGTLFSKYEDRGALDLLNRPAEVDMRLWCRLRSRRETPRRCGRERSQRLKSAVIVIRGADPDAQEVAVGFHHDNLEGWIPELATDAEVFDAFEKAFDYRGDIVITRKDGSKLEGYIFDRKAGKSLEDSVVRLYPATSNEKLSIRLCGDCAAGIWQGSCSRETLGSLGRAVSEEEGRRGEEHRH